MKNKILVGLASLILAVAPAVAHAQSAAAQPPPPATTPLVQHLTPFQLVNLAYGGGLEAQGIPSYGQLENALAQNHVNANTLVAAAVEGRYVPASTLQDGGYINAVRLQLRALGPDSSDYGWP